MVNTKLNSMVKQLAVSNGLCQQWQDEWREDETPDSLMQKFLRGIDFYLSTRFISHRQMLLWFTRDGLHKHNIVVGEKRSILNPHTGIAVGNSNVILRANTGHVCSFYATDNTELKVFAHDHCFIRITLCDNAKISQIQMDNNAKVYICRAGENTQIINTDNPRLKISEQFHLYDK